MTRKDAAQEIVVKNHVGSLLMFRRTVPRLFRTITSLGASRVVVDFADVEFMSRSFADEYLTSKHRCKIRIDERRVPAEVRTMLELVARQQAASHSRAARERHSPPVRAISVPTL